MMVVQIGQRLGELVGPGAGQARAAEQHADLVPDDVVRDRAPHPIDDRAGAVLRIDAGAADLDAFARPAQERRQIELAGRVEAAALVRHRAADQPAGADHRAEHHRPHPEPRAGRSPASDRRPDRNDRRRGAGTWCAGWPTRPSPCRRSGSAEAAPPSRRADCGQDELRAGSLDLWSLTPRRLWC